MLNEYQEMLLESAKQVHKIIQKPKNTIENKITIAGANTLAQTVKAAIQVELVQYKSKIASSNTSKIIHKVCNNEIISLER